MNSGNYITVAEPTLLSTITNPDRRLLKAFVEEVERRAENNMLKTGKLEGAHYAAMKALLKELCG